MKVLNTFMAWSYEPKLTPNNKWKVRFREQDINNERKTSKTFSSVEEAKEFVLTHIPDAYDIRIETERKCKICNNIYDLREFRNKSGHVCNHCRKKQVSDRYFRRRKQGLCKYCDKPSLKKLTVCLDHWYSECARENLKDPNLGPFLKELAEKQNYKCAYTDIPLEVGVNMSLDHIISRYDNPDLVTDKNNVQWVHKDINTMKTRFSHDNFIILCKKICQKFNKSSSTST